MSGKPVTVFDDNKDNGCIAISGMGYYVPLDNFVTLELTNANLEKELESLKKMYVAEKSKNAFIECTGKSLKGIWSDGIVNAVEKLCPDFNYQADNDTTIKINDLVSYSITLAHE